MTEIPTANRDHRRLIWPIVAVLITVVLMLSARWGLHLYRCHVVDRQARKNDRRLIMEPIGPQWIHRLLGSSADFALGRAWGVGLDLNSSWNSRTDDSDFLFNNWLRG